MELNPDESADWFNSNQCPCDADEGESDADIELQMRILELDAELRNVRAQLSSARAMIEMLQATLMDGCPGSTGSRDLEDDIPPLMMAARGGDVAMLEVLVPMASQNDLNTALLVACQHGQVQAAEFLLDHRASVHTDHGSALLWACKILNADLVRLLIERGADPSVLKGCAVRMAVRSGDTEIARILVGNGHKHAPNPQQG